MYCTRCGKQIDYDSTICDECLGKSIRNGENVIRQGGDTAYGGYQNPVNIPTAPEYANAIPTVSPYNTAEKTDPEEVGGNKMYRFGKALTSAIFSYVSITLYILLASYGYYDAVSAGAVFGLGFAIPGMVVGIVTLVKVVKYKNKNALLPIPPFVLSICGTAIGSLSLLISFTTILALS